MAELDGAGRFIADQLQFEQDRALAVERRAQALMAVCPALVTMVGAGTILAGRELAGSVRGVLVAAMIALLATIWFCAKVQEPMDTNAAQVEQLRAGLDQEWTAKQGARQYSLAQLDLIDQRRVANEARYKRLGSAHTALTVGLSLLALAAALALVPTRFMPF